MSSLTWLQDNIPDFFMLLPSIVAIGYGYYIFGISEHRFQNVKSSPAVSELKEKSNQLDIKRQNLDPKLQEAGRVFKEPDEARAAADETHKDEMRKHRDEAREGKDGGQLFGILGL
jgi:hypothetical protein